MNVELVKLWFNAIEKNEKPNVAQLLNKNTALINEKNAKGQTALHLALEQDDFLLVAYLLRRGADIHCACSKTNKTPLMIAVEQADLTLLYTLLHYGAKLSCRDGNSSCEELVDWVREQHIKRPKLRARIENALHQAYRSL